MSDYTLGLDMGSNSIGWALLDTNNRAVVDAGVRVFQEGVDRDTKGAEVSKNETRRTARSARRARKRRNYRKDKLFRMLIRHGLLPKGPDELKEVFELDPYLLRAKGLDEKLDAYEFGRVLYHLNQRRGFWSNRKSGKSKEDGVVVKSATALAEAMDESRSRTIGEYFAGVDSHEKRIRGHYTFRSMYEEEFEALWTKQASFDGELFTDGLKKAIKDETIFFQRPLRWDPETIGDCELEPGEKRCPRADWHARRFRILQTVNNLKLYNPDGREGDLSKYRETIIGELCNRKEVYFDSLRRKLGLIDSQTFNFEEGAAEKKAKLKGDEFVPQLKKAIGAKALKGLEEADIIEINDALIDDNIEDEELVEKLMEQYGFSEEQANGVVNISLPSKYTNFSRLALQKLLPKMEAGLRTDEAIEAVYGKRQAVGEIEKRRRLGSVPDLRNPIVMKALWEVRKVVNGLVREYGIPRKIKIEMARDVKGSVKERDEIRVKQWKNEQENKRAEEELKLMGIRNPSFNDRLKYKLWEECGKECPYTGKPISQHQLFGEHPDIQIEHILPYSRTLDDSYMNKTLCYVNENRLKGNETPYEYYAENRVEQWEEILQRIKVLPYAKRRRFWQKEVVLDNFIQRQLNDTRYISREVVKYLKQLGCIVTGTKGQITSELRHQWGLNNILDYTGAGLKNRDDHRHHAVDAVVTAVTEQKHLGGLAASKYDKSGIEFDPPWEGFREQVAEKINAINVSHRVTRKVSGQLHEETSYGPTGLKDDKGQDIFVYRKPLEALTLPMAAKIVDPVVREIVYERLREFGIDPDGKSKIGKEVWKEPLYMKSKSGKGPQIKKVRIRDVFNNMIYIKDDAGKEYRAVAPGNNHHIEIFEYANKKGRIKRDGKVVTMYEAVRRSVNNKQVIRRDYMDDKKFVCSLSKNEMFMLEVEDGVHVLHRVQKLIQDGRIVLRPHTYAGKVSDSDNPPLVQRKNYNTLRGYKVTVDPIGRIHRAND
ncbi:MAG: type II CRISPR RNA-guided endonuclease Cas9 [Planctomycetota bacterium]|nr:MAG: type II CRISPR RNA-guided endonuclease Cas9 [Planctomycetota bacterium]